MLILGSQLVASAGTFSLTPDNGFTLVLLASMYAIGRWGGDLIALLLVLLASAVTQLIASAPISSTATASLRAELEFVCGTVAGAFYLGFWLHGYTLH
jgi:hypothetical protein